jgi:flagellar protein FlbD
MITLTRVDGSLITINADEIETVESFHDSTLTLKSGKKIIVKESSEDITVKVIEFKRKCFSDAFKNMSK